MQHKNPFHYILTGATGILGSHLLYELLMEIHQNNYQGKLVLLLRSKKDKTIEERFKELFAEEVAPLYLKQIDLDRIRRNNLTLVDFDLRNNLNNDIIFSGKEKYQLIHCAASVNLGSNSSSQEEIKHNNYLGTLNLVQTLLPHLNKVTFISTAFSSGHRGGNITEGFLQSERMNFRNPYEAYKAKTEKEVAQICDGYGLEWQIIRPSIICGRLLDYPFHVIPKFLVFYLFGAFFYRAKEAYGHLPIRIMMNKQSGLNLIPVDYASKAIVRALPTSIKEFNVASSHCVPNTYAVPHMLEKVGWVNYEIVDEIPTNQNAIEKLYYRTVGPQLNDYLQTPAHEFNVETMLEVMQEIKEPNVFDHYLELVDFAVSREFNHVLV